MRCRNALQNWAGRSQHVPTILQMLFLSPKSLKIMVQTKNLLKSLDIALFIS